MRMAPAEAQRQQRGKSIQGNAGNTRGDAEMRMRNAGNSRGDAETQGCGDAEGETEKLDSRGLSFKSITFFGRWKCRKSVKKSTKSLVYRHLAV